MWISELEQEVKDLKNLEKSQLGQVKDSIVKFIKVLDRNAVFKED